MFCMYRLRHLKETDRGSGKTVGKHKTQTDGNCQPVVAAVNGHSWDRWLILMNCACCTKGRIYSHICSVNLMTADEPPSISLCPPPRALFSSYWMLTMSTPVPVAAAPRFGSRPSLMMVHAHGPGRNWQAKLAGICWGSAGPRRWRAQLPAAIYYWTQVVFSFSSTLLPPTQELYSKGWVQA